WASRSGLSTTVPRAPAAGAAGRSRASIRQAESAPAVRLVIVTLATDAMEASASPRKPSDATSSSSASEPILLVAWRVSASGSSSGGMPTPSSATTTRRIPPSSMRSSIRPAPASIAFSSSSLTTEAGRSTTSPAAIWLTSMSGSGAIGRRAAEALCIGRIIVAAPMRGFRRAVPRAPPCGESHRPRGTARVSCLPMDWATLIDIFLHLDKHLEAVVQAYGVWVYARLFAIIFVETGLVVMPFLPGDSLLFVAGAIAGVGGLDIGLLLVLLTVAAVLGDAVNYSI